VEYGSVVPTLRSIPILQYPITPILQHSNTPSLRVAGLEDENDDEDEYEAPGEELHAYY
jgi:hypothetical protein